MIPNSAGLLNASTATGIAVAPAAGAQLSLPAVLLTLVLTAVGGGLAGWLVARRAQPCVPQVIL